MPRTQIAENVHASSSLTPSRPPPPALLLLGLLTTLVVATTLAAHWPVLTAQAVSFDDEEAIIRNRLIQNPSWSSVRRFFSEVTLSSVVRGYYRPLTLTSFMLDWAMGGRPDDLRVFHRTSLALHVGCTVLIVLLVYQIFRRPVPAALTGLLFGVHPLAVEPIAWVMERKTLLAAFFAFACLNALVRYTRRPRSAWYVAAIAAYLLSLLSKPTTTPLPVMMLLMDIWPLRRFKAPPHAPDASDASRRALGFGSIAARLILEKLPFFVLSAVFAVLCVICEQKVNPLAIPAAVSPLHLPLRLCWLIAFYPCKLLLPIRLSSIYTLPEPLALANPWVLAAVAGTLLLAAVLLISRRRTPALWAAAAMFYIGLAPTMGLVEYSWVVASDKYVYFPAVAPLLLLACLLGWLQDRKDSTRAADSLRSFRLSTFDFRLWTVVAALVLTGLLTTATRRYLGYWQTTESLCDHMVALAPHAAPAYNNRAILYGRKQDYPGAIRDCNRAIELLPDYAEAYNNRGTAHDALGDLDRAIDDYTQAIRFKHEYGLAYNNRCISYGKKQEYQQAIEDCTKAIEILPDLMGAYYNRGLAWAGQRDYESAIRDFSRAIDLEPGHAEAWSNRATAHYALGHDDQAIRDYSTAIELNPGHAEAWYKRGLVYGKKREDTAAMADFTRAIQLNPRHADAYHNRAIIYGRQRDYVRAIRDLDQVIELKPQSAEAYYSRGTAHDETGDFPQAIADYTRAIELKPAYPMAYNNRGNTHYRLRDHERAIADYSKAVELDPDLAIAYCNRAACFADMEAYDRARQDVERCRQLGGRASAELMQKLAEVASRPQEPPGTSTQDEHPGKGTPP